MVNTVCVQTINVPSPDGRYLAGLSQGSKVVVRALPSMTIHAVFPAVDRVEQIVWNANSSLVLGLVKSQGIIHVWSIHDLEWTARIEAGMGGIDRAYFHRRLPESLILVSDFGLRVEFWDLTAQGERPKIVRNVCTGPCFSDDGELMAFVLMDSENSGSRLVVLDSQQEIVFSRQIPDLQSRNIRLWWSRDRNYIMVLAAEKLLGLSLISGEIMHEEHLSRLDGKVLACRNGLMALGCHDQSVRVYSIQRKLEFLGAVYLTHEELIVVKGSPRVLRETLGGSATTNDRNLFHLGGAYTFGSPVEYGEVCIESTGSDQVGKISLPSLGKLAHVTGRPPRGGVCALAFSASGSHLAVQTHENAGAVFVIEMARMKLMYVLIHRQPVRHFSWNKDTVAIVSGDPWVHLWRTNGESESIPVKDSSFTLTSCEWCRGGSDLIVSDSQRVACVKLSESVPEHGG